ncbi:MAG: LPS assembly lipoprotein LptE [Pseudomonadota bacterium]
MSWSDPTNRRRALRLAVASTALLALPGCLRPMLAETAPGGQIIGQVDLPPIKDRLGRVMTRTLESRLGRTGADPRFRLEVDQRLSERGLLIAQDNAVTRRQITAQARFRLYETGSAEPVLEGEVVNETGFDETASLFASRTTRRAIEERLIRDLAERIARRVQARAPTLLAAG